MPDFRASKQRPLNCSPRWQMRQSWSIAMDSQEPRMTVGVGSSTDDQEHHGLRVSHSASLVTADQLTSAIPTSTAAREVVLHARREVEDILHLVDDRLVVVVGPCSIHDPTAAIDYAQLLKHEASRHRSDLCIIMRAYLEKPRTTIGWKGLINDPDLDNTFDMNKGLFVARQLYSELSEMGLPLAGELLDLTTPPYLTDFMSLGAIGARTTESQPHRELASTLPFPIGFKNSTTGDVGVAVNSLLSSAGSHIFSNVSRDGTSQLIRSTGNPDCFVILRGGSTGPNYSSEHVVSTCKVLRRSLQTDKTTGIMIDCSHGNSNKDFRNQVSVVKDIAAQLGAGQRNIVGVMIESNLHEGKQSLGKHGFRGLKRGVSITDGCIGWGATVDCLEILAAAVRDRRDRSMGLSITV